MQLEQIREKFKDSLLEEIQFMGETTLNFTPQGFKEALRTFKSQGFETLMDLTAVDYLVPSVRTKVMYWLHNPSNYERVRVTVYVERDKSIDTVIDIWEGADWYERELYDMFGITFTNHIGLKRILMPDDWDGHPMRRDYALTEVPVQFKHGVKPKVPSEIIPYVK